MAARVSSTPATVVASAAAPVRVSSTPATVVAFPPPARVRTSAVVLVVLVPTANPAFWPRFW